MKLGSLKVKAQDRVKGQSPGNQAEKESFPQAQLRLLHCLLCNIWCSKSCTPSSCAPKLTPWHHLLGASRLENYCIGDR